ncbi:MAG: DUF2007 domain-containing protein [Pseudomonadota bacterium]
MKTVFRTDSNIEGHLALHQLQNAGIEAEIHGDMLQGAVGEIAALGNVRVMVDDKDVDAAKEVLADWENQQV